MANLSMRDIQQKKSLSWIKVVQPYHNLGRSDRLPKRGAAVIMARTCIGVWILVVCLQLIHIQIVDGNRYRALANGNRLRERVVYAPRGRILDRNGVELTQNVTTSQLVVYPYLLAKTEDGSRQTEKIAKILGLTPQSLNKQLEGLRNNDINAYVIARRLDQATIVTLEESIPSLPAYAIEDVPSRRYNSDYGLGTILGYTGLVTPENLEQSKDSLLPTDRIGQAGVESSFDATIRGVNGREKIEVDATGQPISLLARQQPKVGKDLKLTIDLSLQKSLYEATLTYMQKSGNGRAASVIVDPRNGDILAMVSLPSYDNNEFVEGISQEQYDQLRNDPTQPLLNKVISNGYATGSIIKPLVASAALQEKIVTPETTIIDKGFIELKSQFDPAVSYRYNGWNLSGLGPMQVRSAIANSSNIYFYTVGGGYEGQQGLGVDRLTRYYRAFGLGAKTNVELPNEQAGRVPDPAWKKAYYNEDWFVGDTYNISIGQGDMLVSPLQITMAESAIANGGTLYRPRISMDEQVVVTRKLAIDSENLEIVREGMRQTVVRGTTNPALFSKLPVQVAAKSGTAETNSPGGRPPHSWYVAFAPYPSPDLLATVLVEEGKEGVSVSAPAIAEVFARHFKK